MKITVPPSDNIFSELGNNTYDFKDLLSELIDNCLAARAGNDLLHVVLTLVVDVNLTAQKFIIADDASGIPADKLGLAISPAGMQTIGSLNEHGLGMKQAIAALGKLESLQTKTSDREKGLEVKQFKFGDIDAGEIEFGRPRGTTITVSDLRAVVTANPTSITRSLIPYLGARYRRFLKPDAPTLDLVVEIRTIDAGTVQYSWQVKEVKPTYFHPSTRENRPVIFRYPLNGNGWGAELTFGYAPKDQAEYDELGIEVPNKFHPYRVALSTQGLDILLHDRVILFHQLSEIGIVPQRHNDYNSIRGEIVLTNGFATAITKNSIRDDAHFRECVDQIRRILTGESPGPGNRIENYIKQKSYPEEIPEALLRDRLAEWLLNNPLQKRTTVNKEYVVEGVEGFIDIFADGEAWELKRDQACALEVYQLFMYMDVANILKGYLVAKSFTTGAEVAVKTIKDHHDKEIVLAPRETFPINQFPTLQEREEYY
jgi:hypothetical protein